MTDHPPAAPSTTRAKASDRHAAADLTRPDDSPSADFAAMTRAPRAYLVLLATVLLLGLGLFVYSQTYAFANDEGFHLLAAQLIGRGQRPYVDFFFPQTPLNAYWNAAWMGLFGESWRVTHAVAAVAVTAAIFLIADYVYRRFPDPGWRLAAALAVAIGFGLDQLVIVFGTLAQAYGLCLLLIVCAFRCAVEGARGGSLRWAAAAGCFAAAAAASSLLTAPAAPVLLGWLTWQARGRGRAATFLAFCVGAIVAFLPLLWLFVQAPRQVFFDVVEYHGLYRQVGWPGATAHNVEVYSAWIDSGQALVLGGLAAVAPVIAWRTDRFRHWRAELVLAAMLAGVQIVYLCAIVPTLRRYFLLTVPFLAVLAAVGLYGLVAEPRRRRVLLAAAGAFFALAAAKSLFDGRDDYVWNDAERIAAKVDEVTPPEGRLVSEEAIYFLTRRAPPRGLEHLDALKLSLPAAMNRMLHLTSREELAKEMRKGRFATVEICESDSNAKETAEASKLFAEEADKLFAASSEFDNCTLHWDFAPKRAAEATAPAGAK